VARRKAPAAIPQDRGHHIGLRLSARRPLPRVKPEGRLLRFGEAEEESISRTRSRRGDGVARLLPCHSRASGNPV